MKIIIPMAGIGKRMRPHTLTTPKPLIPVAGTPVVEILIGDIAKILDGRMDEIAFIIGDFGVDVENQLMEIARQLGVPGRIYHQEEALGTAHALYCARESLDDEVFVAFADTLFKTDFKKVQEEEAIIWTMQIKDPSQFGVVVTDENHYITRFAEKPKTFVSDHAIIGLYYFRDGKKLLGEIEYLIKNDIRGNNEYQLTDVLESMRQKGMKIRDISVDGWFDCGNKAATVNTNREMLKIRNGNATERKNVRLEQSLIIEPCHIAEGVSIVQSIVGPYVSVGKNSRISNSGITNSIIMEDSIIQDANMEDSMIGSHVRFTGGKQVVNLGDYSESEH